MINITPFAVMILAGLVTGLATGSVQSGLLGFTIALGIILLVNLLNRMRD